MSSLHQNVITLIGAADTLSQLIQIILGNSVVTDVQFGHLFVVCIKYVALQEVTGGLFSKISHCSYYI